MTTLINILTKIRNASSVSKKTTTFRPSKLAVEVLKVLKNYHYIKDFSIKDDLVIVELMYNEEGIPAFRVLQAISKPGLKIYRPYKRFREHVSAPGMLIVSTSEGIMSHKEAVQKKIGGKVLCLVA